MCRIYYIFSFIVFYIIKLIQANISIAYVILSRKMDTNPGFVEAPLTLKSDFGMLLFSNLLSMTPGSLVTDISEDRRFVSVHVLDKTNPTDLFREFEKMQDKIKQFTE